MWGQALFRRGKNAKGLVDRLSGAGSGLQMRLQEPQGKAEPWAGKIWSTEREREETHNRSWDHSYPRGQEEAEGM